MDFLRMEPLHVLQRIFDEMKSLTLTLFLRILKESGGKEAEGYFLCKTGQNKKEMEGERKNYLRLETRPIYY